VRAADLVRADPVRAQGSRDRASAVVMHRQAPAVGRHRAPARRHSTTRAKYFLSTLRQASRERATHPFRGIA